MASSNTVSLHSREQGATPEASRLTAIPGVKLESCEEQRTGTGDGASLPPPLPSSEQHATDADPRLFDVDSLSKVDKAEDTTPSTPALVRAIGKSAFS